MTESANFRCLRRLCIAALAALAVVSGPAVASARSGSGESADPSTLFAPAADTRPGSLQGIAAITGARASWAAGYRGQGVDVAVVDTGVSPVPGLDAPGKVVNGADVSFDSQQPGMAFLDGYGHGTQLASIIAGNDGADDPLNAAGGFVGIAPGARIVNVRAGDALGRVDVTQVIAALDWIVANRRSGDLDIRVICLAFGTDSTQSYKLDPLAHAVENAWRHGIVVVTSAGNAGFDAGRSSFHGDGREHAVETPGLTMPAADPTVIAVGGADPHGTLATADDTAATFTSGGANDRNPDFLAPAVSVEGLRVPGSTVDHLYGATAGDGRYIRGSGTSQAAAVVAGLVADLLSARPALTPDQVKALLGSTANRLPDVSAALQGSGEVNLAAAGLAPTPKTKARSASPGGGSIQASRGSVQITHEGVALTGEVDWFGQPLSGTALAAAERSDSAWDGPNWLGRMLLGPWTLPSWDGAAWTSPSWTNEGWDSRSWTAHGWGAHGWSDAAWLSLSWTAHGWGESSWY
jgi:serine protease AprX